MKPTIFLLFICLVIIASCKPDRSKKTGFPGLPYLVEIEKNLDNTESIPLSIIGKKLEYIPLETTPASLVEAIHHIVINDSSVYISDYRKLLQFDRNGRFLKQIGAEGRGPEEYLEVVDFYVNDGSIFLLAVTKILEFDLQGHFKSSFNIPFISFRFIPKETNNLMFYSANQPGRTNDSVYSWYLMSNKGILKARFPNFHKRMNNRFNIAEMPLYNFRGIPHFMEFGSDTMFFFKNETPVPYAFFNLGNMKMETDPVYPTGKGTDNARRELFNRLARTLWINSINESEKHLFIRLQYGFSDSLKYCIFDKTTLQTTILKGKGFSNDLAGGIPFWPKFVYNENVLVDYIDAFKLLKTIRESRQGTSQEKSSGRSDELDLLAKQLNENSNPVLMILK
jgi:hypothetical protein